MGIFSAIKTFFTGKTLYFAGCVTKHKLPEIQKNYLAILEQLNIKVVTLDKEFCCGLPALNKGYVEDFEKLRTENMKLFEDNNISKIITNCPACAYMFKENYDIPAAHIIEVIPELAARENKEEVSYHDSCYLARMCKITEQPRAILHSLGMQIKENDNSGKDTMCCGTGHIDVDTKLSKKVAETRMRDFNTKKVITCCPLCYKHLKDCAEEKEVKEFSEVVLE